MLIGVSIMRKGDLMKPKYSKKLFSGHEVLANAKNDSSQNTIYMVVCKACSIN